MSTRIVAAAIEVLVVDAASALVEVASELAEGADVGASVNVLDAELPQEAAISAIKLRIEYLVRDFMWCLQ